VVYRIPHLTCILPSSAVSPASEEMASSLANLDFDLPSDSPPQEPPRTLTL
jgi:hypothetical protein